MTTVCLTVDNVTYCILYASLMIQPCSAASLIPSCSKGENYVGYVLWPDLRRTPSCERKVVDAGTSMQHHNANIATKLWMKTLLHGCAFATMIRMALLCMNMETFETACRMVCSIIIARFPCSTLSLFITIDCEP